MLSVSNRSLQQLLGTDFSTELTSQKQSTDELCEVLSIRSSLEMVYWSFRVFSQELITHPLLTLVAIAVILVGNFGEAVVPLPDTVYSFLVIIGALGLAYIGSGRL